ncbi:hypothetical protein Tco_1235709 [Tanacetum coccineum]
MLIEPRFKPYSLENGSVSLEDFRLRDCALSNDSRALFLGFFASFIYFETLLKINLNSYRARNLCLSVDVCIVVFGLLECADKDLDGCSSTNGDRELEFLANGGRRSPWLMGDTRYVRNKSSVTPQARKALLEYVRKRKQIGEIVRNPHRQGQRSGMHDPAPDLLSQSRQGKRGPQRTSSTGVSSDIKNASSTANIVDELSSIFTR